MGDLFAMDAGTGAIRWHRALASVYSSIGNMQCRPSPLIEGERLILFVGGTPGATVLAVDKQTGVEKWKALDEPISSSSPLIIQVAGRRQLIVWTLASVTALDPTKASR